MRMGTKYINIRLRVRSNQAATLVFRAFVSKNKNIWKWLKGFTHLLN